MKPVYFGARKAAGHLLRVNTGRFIVWERSAYAVEDLYAIHNIEVVLWHTMGTRRAECEAAISRWRPPLFKALRRSEISALKRVSPEKG